PVAELQAVAPDARWRAAVDPAIGARLLSLEADLHLKSDNYEAALPLIEELAPLQPTEAMRLYNELLKVWASTHDQSRGAQDRQSANPAVPLTRALQRRSLDELQHIVQRLH